MNKAFNRSTLLILLFFGAALAWTSVVSARAVAVDANCPNEKLDHAREAIIGKPTAVVGGIGACERKFGRPSVNDLTCWDQRSTVNWSGAIQIGHDLVQMSEDFFYQELAANSHAQARCRTKVIDQFDSDQATRTKLDGAAGTAFNAIVEELRDLMVYREEKARELEKWNLNAASDPRALGPSTRTLRERLQQELSEIDETIARRAMHVPMGYDPDVLEGILAMARDGQYSASKYRESILRARTKYATTVDYFDHKRVNAKPDAPYCLGRDFKLLATETGQTNAWLQTLPEGNFRGLLQCRLDASYGKGPKRVQIATTVGTVVAMFFGVGLPAAAARGFTVAAGAARAASSVEAVGLLLSLEGVRQSCFRPDFIMSADNQECEPNAVINNMIAQSGTEQNQKRIGIDVANCAINSAVVSGGVAKHIVTFLKAQQAKRLSDLQRKTVPAEADQRAHQNAFQNSASKRPQSTNQKTVQETEAERLLNRPLNDKERDAVNRAHNICPEGPGPTGVFSKSCKFQKALACRRGLPREVCESLLDRRILGNFAQTSDEQEAVVDQLAEIEGWYSSDRIKQVLSGREQREFSDDLNKSIEQAFAGEKVDSIALQRMNNLKERAEMRTVIRDLKPGQPVNVAPTDQIRTITMEKNVIKFLQDEERLVGPRFMEAIHKGLVGNKYEAGIKRMADVHHDFVEVKLLGSEGGQYRLFGCLKSGHLTLLRTFRKGEGGGSDLKSRSHLKDLCR